MDERDYITAQKNEEELEEAKRKQRKNIKTRAVVAIWFAAGLGCIFGGMFAGLNWLLFTGLGILIGGALFSSLAILGSMYVKSAKKNVQKYGGSLKPYIYKGIVLIIAISAAVVFGVLGFVFSEFYIIGTIVSFFAFVLIFFAWQP